MPAAIDVRDLVVRYGLVTAVDGLNLICDKGEVLALLGPNGAGKTTTVETLEGYRRPTSGAVRVLGLDPIADRRELAPKIGVMLQRGGVYPAMSPREALRLFAAYYDDPEDPDALLERVALRDVEGSPWRRLSGGEQQRLSLALALVGRPSAAFLDEPTAGVDPSGRLAIRQAVRDLRDRGAAVLLTTHEMEEAERLADRIVIVDRGVVVAAGSPAELMTAGVGHEIRFGAPPGLAVGDLGGSLGATVTEDQPGEYRVEIEATPAAVAALTAWLAARDLPLADLRAGRQRLEDVFLRLTAPSPKGGG
jgi:ABC-2 type transport system ATP-binding protein